MTTPDVPLRLELSFEVPGTPDDVWDAIATSNGISSWMLRTDVEEREGGALVLHMGDTDSPATVTGWEPPHRFAYEEPEWAALAGRPDADVSPMATEFLVEARSGGTCVVRVVTSAFGTGADWEREFFADMEKYWAPFFEHLRLYLTHFPGQRVTSMENWVDLAGSPEAALAAIGRALGAADVGQPVRARGLTGHVERASDIELLLRITAPIPGLLAFFALPREQGGCMVQQQGYWFSDDAPGFVERERPSWAAWLQALDLSTPAARP
jgi:uncharacterized protein YndB with AHSA1/START domain